MVRLTILRHAKSSWAQPGLGDIDRPLNARGQQQMAQLARWFAAHDQRPDQIACSPAKRTRQTLQELGEAPTAAFVERLYTGGTDAYLETVWASEAQHLMIIGHNPTCDELVRYLARPGGDAARRLAGNHYGTANLTQLAFDTDTLADIAANSGTVEHFLRPSDLASAPSGV